MLKFFLWAAIQTFPFEVQYAWMSNWRKLIDLAQIPRYPNVSVLECKSGLLGLHNLDLIWTSYHLSDSLLDIGLNRPLNVTRFCSIIHSQSIAPSPGEELRMRLVKVRELARCWRDAEVQAEPGFVLLTTISVVSLRTSNLERITFHYVRALISGSWTPMLTKYSHHACRHDMQWNLNLNAVTCETHPKLWPMINMKSYQFCNTTDDTKDDAKAENDLRIFYFPTQTVLQVIRSSQL